MSDDDIKKMMIRMQIDTYELCIKGVKRNIHIRGPPYKEYTDEEQARLLKFYTERRDALMKELN